MIGAGIPKAQLMDSETMARVLTRMAHEIMERAGDLQDLILVGIRRRGVPLAQRLADVIAADVQAEQSAEEPSGGAHRYVCKVCGYVYEGDSLPEDYKCPLCGAGADYFRQEA